VTQAGTAPGRDDPARDRPSPKDQPEAAQPGTGQAEADQPDAAQPDKARPETPPVAPSAAPSGAPRPIGYQSGNYSLSGVGIGVSAEPKPASQGAPQPAPRPRPATELPPVAPSAPPPPPRPITTPDPRRWPVRGPILAGLISITLLLGGVGAWAWSSRIAGAVVASGQVEVERQRQVVQHPDGGVVQDIAVKDGQSVAAGELLIRLDGTLLATELAIVEGQYFETLARRGRLEAERADAPEIIFPQVLLTAAPEHPEIADLVEGQRSLFLTRRDTLHQSLEQLGKQSEQVSRQVEGVEAQIAALAQQRALIAEELTDQESLLSRGLAQASRVLSLQREAARLDGQLGELKASRAQAETKQTELDIQRLRLGAERREEAETELRDQGYRELEMAERRRSLTEQMSRLDIRAPVAGIVYDLQVTTPRSVIRAADPLLYIIPQDRPLVIGARLATINVDEVHAGQPVVLRFSAFSSRTTPEIDGVLARVSADALMDQATQTPYYRAEVTIPPAELEKLGELALVPGMPVEVYIQTGERSPMAYLLKPLADYFNRAFREG
jgi:HlyD family type I secretion membrane fusion protein